MINLLRSRNQMLIEKYASEQDYENLTRQRIISQILMSDNAFKEISIETAYAVLLDLGFDRAELRQVYIELTL